MKDCSNSKDSENKNIISNISHDSYNFSLENYTDIDNSMLSNLNLKKLNGLSSYSKIWQQMSDFTNFRRNNRNVNDEFWYLEHNQVFTLGQAGKPEHIIIPNNIETIKTDRGGQVTYHGPGQLVVYLLIDLKRKELGIKKLICLIEESVISYLKKFNITAHRIDGAPGIYVDGAKICSMGLRVRNSCTYHGISFNINMDITPFSYINPCGYKGLQVVQLKDLNGPDNIDEVIPGLNLELTKYLNYNI